MSRESPKLVVRPFLLRHPWRILSFFIVIISWFSLTYAFGNGFLPDFLTQEGLNGRDPNLWAGGLWISWTIASLVVGRRLRDPMAAKLPHTEFMIPAMEKLIQNYETGLRSILLRKFDEAGKMGFMGGRGNKKFEITRFSIIKVAEHGQRRIDEVRRFQSVKPQNKLRGKYYNVESSVEKMEILNRRVNRFLRFRGVDPEEVAPSCSVSD